MALPTRKQLREQALQAAEAAKRARLEAKSVAVEPNGSLENEVLPQGDGNETEKEPEKEEAPNEVEQPEAEALEDTDKPDEASKS